MIMITDKEINEGLGKAYKKAGHNAYFGNGFEAGVKFAQEQVKNLTIPVVMPRFNVNHYATIYPNDRGWKKIIVVIAENHCISGDEAKEIVDKKRTEDNGYRDQLWCIMSELHSMYFNGQNYFENSFMLLENGA